MSVARSESRSPSVTASPYDDTTLTQRMAYWQPREVGQVGDRVLSLRREDARPVQISGYPTEPPTIEQFIDGR